MSVVPREIAIMDPREWLSERVHRPPGRWLARRLVDTAVTPVHITILSGIAGVVAGILLAAGAHDAPLRIWGGIALILSCMLDCADGELARARKQYSLIGMMADGLTDNIVGTSVFVAMAYNIVVYTGEPWLWLLGVVAGLSAAAHVWVFDAKKKQYLQCLGLGHQEEEQSIEALRTQRREARQRGEYVEAFLLGAYIFFRRTQKVGVTTAVVADTSRFWQTNRHRMRAWTLMGSSTHFFILYVAAIMSPIWPAAVVAYALIYAGFMNLLFMGLLIDNWNQA